MNPAEAISEVSKANTPATDTPATEAARWLQHPEPQVKPTTPAQLLAAEPKWEGANNDDRLD